MQVLIQETVRQAVGAFERMLGLPYGKRRHAPAAHGFSVSLFLDVPGKATTRCSSSPESWTRT
ncbi:hypothetical protein GCM10027161_61160 [Microbispora hainanensis]